MCRLGTGVLWKNSQRSGFRFAANRCGMWKLCGGRWTRGGGAVYTKFYNSEWDAVVTFSDKDGNESMHLSLDKE
ncbi:MAG: hypothetical protein IKZ66_02270 [Schwartzia sp.]|nr:hypothetical protein [Schwartzia sp. (in: firmicutes)]